MEASVDAERDPDVVRPGYYRVTWMVDLPRDEFTTPREAAEAARHLAAGGCPDCDGVVNVYLVVDGETGAVTEHDLA